MFTFFDQPDAIEASAVFHELGGWIYIAGFPPLKSWWQRCLKQWSTIANHFAFRVTTALYEGVNNVIKSVKRAAFGFRNMDYFQLKILQRCGFLNSQYMTDDGRTYFSGKNPANYKSSAFELIFLLEQNPNLFMGIKFSSHKHEYVAEVLFIVARGILTLDYVVVRIAFVAERFRQ